MSESALGIEKAKPKVDQVEEKESAELYLDTIRLQIEKMHPISIFIDCIAQYNRVYFGFGKTTA